MMAAALWVVMGTAGAPRPGGRIAGMEGAGGSAGRWMCGRGGGPSGIPGGGR